MAGGGDGHSCRHAFLWPTEVESDMRRAKRVLIGGSVLVLGIVGTATSAAADQPPGQLGYEGQPGNQGGGGNPPGLLGYEGQPGNQGG
jgi:hypothetical protein